MTSMARLQWGVSMKRIWAVLVMSIAALGLMIAMAVPASAQAICIDLHIGIGNIGWHPPPICIG
jgi:hypothetical protein